MKIENDRQLQNINAYQSQAVEKKAAEESVKNTEKAKNSPGVDRVELSVRKGEVDKLSKQADAITDTARAEKIAELKKQVSEGTYKVDPRMVAEKMLDSFRGIAGGGGGGNGR